MGTTGGNGVAIRGGGGGGATWGSAQNGGNGGAGGVILKYSNAYTATFSGGVTQTTDSVSVAGFKITTITAAGVSDTVSWA